MKQNRWLMGAVAGCLVGASVGACGTSGTGSGGSGGASSSQVATSSSSSSSSSSASSSGSASSSSSGGMDGGTCSPPSKLFPPNPDAGTITLFCPFSGVDGGKDIDCDYATQHCCEPKMGAATCDPLATACAAGDTDWQCEDPSQCPQGQVCCGTGTLMINPDPMCANFATGFKGTHCAASCTANEIVMCTSTGQCAAGKTCTPFRTKGAQVGGCN